jgi:hypothetical protein
VAANLCLEFLLCIPIGIVSAGLQQFALRRPAGENSTILEIFQSKDWFVPVASWTLIYHFSLNALYTPSYWYLRLHYFPETSTASLHYCIAWIFFATFVTLAMSILFLLVPLFIIERRLTVWQAVIANWRSVRPSLLRLSLGYIVVTFVAVVGIFACGIGALYTYGVSFIFPALVFRQLTEEPI